MKDIYYSSSEIDTEILQGRSISGYADNNGDSKQKEKNNDKKPSESNPHD